MLSSEEDARQIVISALQRTTEPGDSQPKGTFLWPFSAFSGHIANQTAEEVDYAELRTNFRNAESVEVLLRRMLASATVAVTALKAKFNDMANQRYFQTLPDEVLSMVFEMTYHSISDSRKQLGMVKKLSLVSRRIRRIVMPLPVLWSSLSSAFLDVKYSKLFASRVVAPIITFSIYGAIFYNKASNKEAEQKRILGMYQLAVSISSRIRSFHIHISYNDRKTLEKIAEICSNASFPALLELTLDSSDYLTRDPLKLCSNWNMPSLRKLNVVECLPELPSEALLRITTCSFEVNRRLKRGEGIWWTPDIVQFIASLTAVKDLRANIRLHPGHSDPEPFPNMNSVERLILVLQDYDVGADNNFPYDSYLPEFIKFPSLTSFRLELGAKELEKLGKVLKNLKFKMPPTSVTEVELSAGTKRKPIDGRMPRHLLGEWCKAFKGLKSLTLEDQRDTTYRLIPFTTPVDAVKVVDCTKGEMSGSLLGKLPSLWEYYERPCRTAVIGAEDLREKRGEKLQFVEKID